MDNNKIGKFIASLRKEKGLTQQELGDKLFVTDKAVSKWERGLSLPDISLLKKLAEILDVDVIDILEGKKNSNKKINIEEELEKIKNNLNKKHKRKLFRIITIIVVLIFIIIYILFRNVYLGYNIETLEYSHTNKNINLGIPKTSFMLKHNDRSYSFKNLRNSNIVENEVKKYLKTLKYLTCNDTIYYYNEEDNFSIINYSVDNHILYNTISYEIVDNDYCYMEKLDEYAEKLQGLKRFHTLNGGTITLEEDWDNKLEIMFLDGGYDSSKIYEFKANMKVIYYERIEDKLAKTNILEESNGTFEIKGDNLYYYRNKIIESSSDIKIPDVSVFKIDNGKLILQDNYLDKYQEEIVLE